MNNEFESLNVSNKVDNYREGVDESQYVDYKNNFEAAKERERIDAAGKVKQYNFHKKISDLNNVNNKNFPNKKNANNKFGVNTIRNKVNSHNPQKNSRMTNQLASALIPAAGAPKPIANSAVNSKIGQKAIDIVKKKNPFLNVLDKLMGGEKKETEEETANEGTMTFKLSPKTIIAILIASPAVLNIVVFICVLITASQVYLNVITLGNSNSASMSSDEINDKIERSSDEDRNNQIDDDDFSYAKTYNYSITIKRKQYAAPYILKSSKDYSETNLSELDDIYGNSASSKDFYYKLHDIYTRYSTIYNVKLNLPLLMSTLMIESKDMNKVYASNTSEGYDIDTIEDRSVDHDLDYYHDWSNYKITSKSSAHDIEILAQNMVSVDENGNYKYDESKYKEFLKEFLEKKYFIKGGATYDKKPDSKVPGSNSNSNSNSSYDSTKDGNYVKDVTYLDSSFGEIIYYNQGDYSNYYYSSDPKKAEYKQNGKSATIQSHGCGPTSLAIVVSSMLNKKITPIDTTKKVCKAGGCTSSGSKYTTIASVGKDYGLTVTTTQKSQDVIDALGTKKSLVIVLMGPGTFTTGGHFIVLTGVNSKGQVSVADPGSRSRTNQKWFPFNTVVEQKRVYDSGPTPFIVFSR